VRDRERELKRILNAPGLEMASNTIVVPGSEPNPVAYRLDPERLAEQAMDQRMELLELELQIAAETANVALARNNTLPLVNLDYTYNVNGLGPSFDDSIDQARRSDFADHRFGLQVEVPIGNEAARSRLRQALLSRIQTLATRDQRAQLIRQEVYNAVDQLAANWQRYVAAVERVRLAELVLAIEIRQFEQGLRTSREVLDAQTNLADARSAAVGALSDHQISQVDIAFATGTILGATHVVWEPAAAPNAR
jgi:outer membrane protein TolC